MAYIKKIGLENFRLFKDKTVFDLAPITILTGTNSSGKSSLIKALQLLKSSIKETGGINELNFSGGRHNLGWFGQVINSDSENNELVITLDFPFRFLKDKTLIDLTYSSKSKESLTGYLKKIKIYFETGEIIYQIEKLEVNHVEQESNIKEKGSNRDYSNCFYKINANFEFLIGKLSETYNLFWIKSNLPNNPENKTLQDFILNYKKHIEKYHEVFDLVKADIFKDFHFRYTDTSRTLNEEIILSSNKNEHISQLFENLSDDNLEELLTKFKSVSSNGIDLENINVPNYYFENHFFSGIDLVLDMLKVKFRDYLFFDEITKITKEQDKKSYRLSDFGKYVFIEFFDKALKDSIKDIISLSRNIESLSSFRANTERLYSANLDTLEINRLLWDFSQTNPQNWETVKKFLTFSFNHFGIGEEIKINSYQGAVSEILVVKQGKEILLADLGYGYSQFIPIVLKIALIGINQLKKMEIPSRMNPTLLLLEEPESNLHPSLQSKLADVIILAASNFNIQFIIETHSEYLIRNFQYLTAKKEIKTWDTKIYYFNHPDSEEFKERPYREINIQEDGRLSNEFGEGFFDEIPRLLAFLYNTNFN